MDSMNGVEAPDNLPPIHYVDVSNEEYQKVMNLFQPERSKREDSEEQEECLASTTLGNCHCSICE